MTEIEFIFVWPQTEDIVCVSLWLVTALGQEVGVSLLIYFINFMITRYDQMKIANFSVKETV